MDSAQLAGTILAIRRETSCAEAMHELLNAANRYARLRADWALLDRAGRVARDRERFSAHEVLLDAFNILSRAMLRAGENNEWRGDLGTERGFIGDVACHLHCMLGLSAR